MPVRKIIEIDEEKCDGCGLCVDACHESAIQLIDGKAKLVSDILCDGFGDCLGECPQDAITITEREAVEYSQEAVDKHVQKLKGADKALPVMGCPGSAPQSLGPMVDNSVQLTAQEPPAGEAPLASDEQPSALRNWPVQLHLAPVQAPYFEGAKLLIAADCVPFSLNNFHGSMLAGRTLLIGCPKLDDTSAYLEKLAAIFKFNDLASVEIAYMEVPCCRGLVALVGKALETAGKSDTLKPSLTKVGMRGTIVEKSVA